MNRDRAITLIIVLNFMIVLLLGVNYNVTNPTKINKIIASTYKTPANKAFTDQNFYNCIIDNYNKENTTSLAYTTNLTDEQLSSIKELHCSSKSITSTNGLELIKNLTILFIADNQLTNLDVGKNVNLTDLHVSYNKLTSLDVNNNINLKSLIVQANKLTNLDVNGAKNLTELRADGNQLTNLDVSSNVKLTNLTIYSNELTNLDVSNNVNLTELYVYNNKLTNLDVSNNVKLKQLRLEVNKLTNLDVSNNVNLTYLSVYNNQLTSLAVNSNINLVVLTIGNNQLTNLDVGNNVNLTNLWIGNNQLTKLDVNNNIHLTNLRIDTNLLENIDVSNNVDLTWLYVTNNQLRNLNVNKNVNLTQLDVYGNELTNLDVGKNVNLTHLNVSDNKLTNLDISKNVKLTKLYVSDNELTNLDISKNVDLTWLYVTNNQLRNLNVNKNVNLTDLDVSDNKLTNLDISKNVKLTKLYVSDNKLTNLDISKNVNLTIVDAYKNKLTGLDTRKNVNLEQLRVYNNELTSLDVSNNINLRFLNADHNPYILGKEIVYKNDKVDLSYKIDSENYKLNNKFTKEYKYSELDNTRLDNSIIDNENVGKYEYKLYFNDGNSNDFYNISGTYTIYVTDLKSNKYKINEKNGYIYTKVDADKEIILSNLSTEYGTLEINGNKVQIKDGKNTVKEFYLLNLISSKYIINEEKGYIYTGTDTNKETILSNLSTEYGTLEINDNKLQVKDGNNIIKEFKILNLTSKKYKLNNDNIYTGVNEFNKDDINTECALNLKDNLIEVSYDNEVLGTFKLIRITSSKYKITDKYIYTIGNIDLNNINITNGNVKINNNKLEIIYNNISIDSLDILSIDFGTLKVSNNVIVIIKEIPYKEFTDEIKVSNVSYKIYKEEKEVTSGNIEKGMKLKVISETYGIIEEYKITNEYIDVSKLNIDKNNFINDFEVLDTYKKILDKIDTSGEIKIIDNAGKELTSNDNVRTGSKIRIELTTETKEYTVVVLGDVTGTGKITMADVMKTANYLLDNSVIKEECYKKASDVTKDGNIKISDVMKLANYVLNGKF